MNIIYRIKQLYDEGKDKDEVLYNILADEFPLVINDKESANREEIPGLATSKNVTEIKRALNEQKKI